MPSTSYSEYLAKSCIDHSFQIRSLAIIPGQTTLPNNAQDRHVGFGRLANIGLRHKSFGFVPNYSYSSASECDPDPDVERIAASNLYQVLPYTPRILPTETASVRRTAINLYTS